jgi:ABC-type sugar transport system substrate-binding protein
MEMSAGELVKPNLWSTEGPLFHDRAAAGRELAERLGAYRGRDTVVLGIPRGGVAVAAEVARQLDAQLDVIVARKIGAPGQQELAIGAVTADGGRVLNQEIIDLLPISETYLKAAGKRPGQIKVAGFDLSPATIAAIRGGWTGLVIDQQEWMQAYLAVLQICLTKVYGFSGLHINTGAGFVDKTNVDMVAPLAEKNIR